MGRGPQQRVPVEVLDEAGEPVARAVCFFSTWVDDATDEPRWRGFLGNIEPPGALGPGATRLRLEGGAHLAVDVTAVRTAGEHGRGEQAVFTGMDAPPALEG
jgi:hypothetical protein